MKDRGGLQKEKKMLQINAGHVLLNAKASLGVVLYHLSTSAPTILLEHTFLLGTLCISVVVVYEG